MIYYFLTSEIEHYNCYIYSFLQRIEGLYGGPQEAIYLLIRLIHEILTTDTSLLSVENKNWLLQLRDIAKQWVELEENRKRARWIEGLGSGDYPPLTTECSADLLEYVAAQDIPNFGVHAYYAISNEPINNWENIEKGIFPKGNFQKFSELYWNNSFISI